MERKPKRKRRERKRFTKKRAAMGLAAALAAYAVYLLSTPKGRRRPVTELSNALGLDLAYVSWRGVHYAYYLRPGVGRPVVLLHSVHVVAAAHELFLFVLFVGYALSGPVRRLVGGRAPASAETGARAQPDQS